MQKKNPLITNLLLNKLVDEELLDVILFDVCNKVGTFGTIY